MHEEMQEYKIILTWEAIYDVTDIADYIEEENGQQHADRFQSDLKEQMQNLSQFSTAFPRTQILYRGYSIHKRSFPPSIIFYIIMDATIPGLLFLRLPSAPTAFSHRASLLIYEIFKAGELLCLFM